MVGKMWTCRAFINGSTNAFYEWNAFTFCIRSLLFFAACDRAFNVERYVFKVAIFSFHQRQIAKYSKSFNSRYNYSFRTFLCFYVSMFLCFYVYSKTKYVLMGKLIHGLYMSMDRITITALYCITGFDSSRNVSITFNFIKKSK